MEKQVEYFHQLWSNGFSVDVDVNDDQGIYFEKMLIR